MIDRASDMQGKWCILRTAGPSTLSLARTLNGAGIAAWTPTIPSRRRRPKSSKTIDLSVPLVPTFLFAPLADAATLLALRSTISPSFTMLRLGDRLATVRDRSLDQLRAEEAAAVAKMAALKDREARASLLRTEAARRKALRAERRDYPAGSEVTARGAIFAGMVGVVEGGNGRSFLVNFGGSLRIEIEAWQLDAVEVGRSLLVPA